MASFSNKYMAVASLVGLAILAGIPDAKAGEYKDEDIRAALIFNILKFTEFSSPQTQNGQFNLCARSSDDIWSSLKALDGRSAGDYVIRVQDDQANPTMSIACDIAYISSDLPASRQNQIIKSSLLTFGETSDFIQKGGTIEFVKIGRQTRFKINQRITQSKEISISSRVMKLAMAIE